MESPSDYFNGHSYCPHRRAGRARMDAVRHPVDFCALLGLAFDQSRDGESYDSIVQDGWLGLSTSS